MPLLNSLAYKTPWYLGNGHAQTILPHYIRRFSTVLYSRERLELSDGDFLDLDWLKHGNRRLVIVSHGLEGSSKRYYAVGLAKALQSQNWDVLAWNMRGCSGEPNRLLRSYHSGESDDLHSVIQHVVDTGSYDSICLVGFSLGGNITLKLLGEGRVLPSEVKAAVTFSVPCDLEASADKLDARSNRIYMRYFLSNLREKILQKYIVYPNELSVEQLARMRNFHEFDEAYTAPLHGFSSAKEYWTKSSSRQFLPNIKLPTLLLTSQDDPFLDGKSFPLKESENSDYFYLELTRGGGHVGYVEGLLPFQCYAERRCIEFLNDHIY